MSVTAKHPEYTASREYQWRQMRDTVNGSLAVKRRGTAYLPMPNGFKAMADQGEAAYSAYTTRADFPEIVAPSIGAMVGIVHGKEIQVDMPDALKYLWEDADGHGMSLEAFHRTITRHLLTLGRYAVLADAPASGEPFLAGYAAESIINWDVNFYVLDETYLKRDGFIWTQEPRYRVLELVDGLYQATEYEGNLGQGEPITPTARGNAPMRSIPFAIANARDLSAAIESPPLIGVSDAAISIYQLSADYRLQLFMSGQETLVAINGEAPSLVGAGVVHQMNGTGEMTPDLKYVSPSCSGIEAHKEAMTEQREAAVMAGARMFENSGNAQESGEARKLRFASETANLMSVAMASCGLLERGLKGAAMLAGLNPNEIVVTPPSDLLDNTMSPADLAALFDVYEKEGMSWQTYYERGQRGGIFSTERDADTEFDMITGDFVASDEPPMPEPDARQDVDATRPITASLGVTDVVAGR